MSGVRFNLDRLNSIKEEQVFVVFRYNSLRLKYAIGKKIEPKFWDNAKQRAKNTPKFPFSTEFNLELHEWEQKVLTTFKQYIQVENRYPSLDEFREELDIFKGVKLPKQPNAKENQITLYSFIESFIKEKSLKIKNKNNTYMFVLGHLQAYQKIRKRKDLEFDDITMDFFVDFVQEYLYKKHRFKANYVSKLISTLKTILKESFNRKLHHNTIHTNKNFHISEVAVDNIYLTQSELDALYSFDLSNNAHLERVRDLFIIGCYTGLRFSDFTSLKSEHISKIGDKEIITLITQKTGEKVSIPVHKFVLEIFKKYNNSIPKAITNQKMNEYLKELGKLIGFDRIVIKTEYEAGNRNNNEYRKFELISSHTARRSFATNAYKSGIPAISIMKITGHTSMKSFLKYIKISAEENAIIMTEYSFFN